MSFVKDDDAPLEVGSPEPLELWFPIFDIVFLEACRGMDVLESRADIL